MDRHDGQLGQVAAPKPTHEVSCLKVHSDKVIAQARRRLLQPSSWFKTYTIPNASIVRVKVFSWQHLTAEVAAEIETDQATFVVWETGKGFFDFAELMGFDQHFGDDWYARAETTTLTLQRKVG